MTNDSRRFGFTYGYDDAVTAAMQERTYQWMDIVFVDFGEISGDCLLRKSRPAIVLSGTEYNESSPILTVAPMTRSLSIVRQSTDGRSNIRWGMFTMNACSRKSATDWHFIYSLWTMWKGCEDHVSV